MENLVLNYENSRFSLFCSDSLFGNMGLPTSLGRKKSTVVRMDNNNRFICLVMRYTDGRINKQCCNVVFSIFYTPILHCCNVYCVLYSMLVTVKYFGEVTYWAILKPLCSIDSFTKFGFFGPGHCTSSIWYEPLLKFIVLERFLCKFLD